MSSRCRLLMSFCAVVAAWPIGLLAQSPPTGTDSVYTTSSTRRVAAGAKYKAGRLHKLVLGEDYRALWTAPIEVPVLDLVQEAGGLTPTERGGSMQTNSLRFAGADGREYVFRPLEKDFTKGLPADLRETLISDIAQDQVSGYHPASSIVVSSLLDATGLHHPRPRMMVMPDDARLGTFQKEFAGVVGTFEERPTRDFDAVAGQDGAADVISSEKLFERIRKNRPDQVDTKAYLSARLFDVFVGDRDRHRDQWRWGKFSTARDAAWEPIPRDRDMPFAKFEGLGPWMVRGFVPQLVSFEEAYPSMVWLNWNGREIDRRLLGGMERASWDSAARVLQAQLTDSVLHAAIDAMAEPYVKLNGDRLYRELVARRENLPRAADDFYRVLAREVNLSGTDGNDLIEVTREGDGSVTVAMYASGTTNERAPGARPVVQRRFLPGETHEVRLYLNGGNDHLVVKGRRNGDILLRVVGGDGDDTFDDRIPKGDAALQLYDEAGTNRVISEAGLTIDRKPYQSPTAARAEDEPRDWGSWSLVMRGLSVAPGVGMLGSVNYTRFGYAFRHAPFSSRSSLRLDVSLSERRPRLTWDATFPRANSHDALGIHAVASGIDLLHYYGEGNETANDQGRSAYKVEQDLYAIEPKWTHMMQKGVSLTASTTVQYSNTHKMNGTVLSTERPYGTGDFGSVSGRLALDVDRRDVPSSPTKGFRFAASTSLTPAMWSVDQTYGDVDATASTYVSAKGPLQPTLAIRAGGRTVWGDYPYFAASHIGGGTTVRGWDDQRFAGRSSAYGNAEVRMRLGRWKLIAPADVGVLGFQDVGRVFADHESSSEWHLGTGGGIWIAPLVRTYTVSLSMAHSRERNGVYLTSGFAF
ncbi:MAG: BamA/TamA family outer membrane protein [Gemmatimonadaceae bacterium]